ncbi:unnamed protein product [Pleuronectes platessa]|uniref:Uncharacterized protein n=1 Tax=Pleuronectes platessa TaxID=8262 RepID=A0A9N7TRH5_PLEPL|nr:unnamed protein product [Pleuronectes platessa]
MRFSRLRHEEMTLFSSQNISHVLTSPQRKNTHVHVKLSATDPGAAFEGEGLDMSPRPPVSEHSAAELATGAGAYLAVFFCGVFVVPLNNPPHPPPSPGENTERRLVSRRCEADPVKLSVTGRSLAVPPSQEITVCFQPFLASPSSAPDINSSAGRRASEHPTGQPAALGPAFATPRPAPQRQSAQPTTSTRCWEGGRNTGSNFS